MDAGALESLILQHLPDAVVRVESPRGDDSLYNLYVASPSFQELSLIDQHRMVYAALRSILSDKAPLLSIQTFISEK